MVAIGRANGQVALYSLTIQGKKAAMHKAGQLARPTRVLSVVDWGHKSHLTGGVAFMQVGQNETCWVIVGEYGPMDAD